MPDILAEFLGLAGSVYLTYKMVLPEEKPDLLKIVTSNRLVDGENLVINLNFHYRRWPITFKIQTPDRIRTEFELL